MGNEKQRTGRASGFASEGHTEYLDFHLDAEKFQGVSEWERRVIESHLARYAAFLKDDNILPLHRAKATQNARRLQFELDYRDGKYEKTMDMSELEDQFTPETIG